MNNYHLPNIPWEDRPAGNSDVVCRYRAKPIIPRNLIRSAKSIFNPLPGQIRGCFPLCQEEEGNELKSRFQRRWHSLAAGK